MTTSPIGNGKQVTRRFYENGNRYQFDTLFSVKEGWSQLDTNQDAWYYGNWINHRLRKVVSYAEGDYTETTYPTDKGHTKPKGRICPRKQITYIKALTALFKKKTIVSSRTKKNHRESSICTNA